MAPRETENNAYAKFWGDKQRTLWYVMVFLEWSIETSFKSISKSHAYSLFCQNYVKYLSVFGKLSMLNVSYLSVDCPLLNHNRRVRVFLAVSRENSWERTC